MRALVLLYGRFETSTRSVNKVPTVVGRCLERSEGYPLRDAECGSAEWVFSVPTR